MFFIESYSLKQLEILDEETILSMLTIQIDMGIDMAMRDSIPDYKEELINNVKEL